ncbi:MAG TPA: hypothetical protein VE090_00900 [Methylomirabilota bacterium]|nr:hypothetical protein [Methylomirabilota bacterium]
MLRIVDAGKIIGTDIKTGQETTLYTVITKYNVVSQTENLVTTHPGLPY